MTSASMTQSLSSPIDPSLHEEYLVQQWERDMSLRNIVRADFAWRGNVSTAMKIADLDAGVAVGDRYLYSNEDVTWMILRDVPSGMFPAVQHLNERNTTFASVTKASISRYGVPVVDFGQAQANWNFRFQPFSSKQTESHGRVRVVQPNRDTLHARTYAREFAIFNLMSASMTRWAYTAVDHTGQPFRSTWFRHRPLEMDPVEYQLTDVVDAFPDAVLGFSDEQAQNLYWAVTEAPQHPVVDCPECQAKHSVTDIRDRRFTDSGDFIGVCPSCRVERKYHLADTCDSSKRRQFSSDFKWNFCRSVGRLLPIYAPCDVRYDGPGELDDTDLVVHRFVREDGRSFCVRMLPTSRVSVAPGSKIEAGEVIAQLLPPNKNFTAWRQASLETKWSTLHTVVPRRDVIPMLLRQWFEFSGFRIPGEDGYKFWPASLVTPACRSVQPTKLYWDISPCARHDRIDMTTGSVILPPVRMKAWQDWQFTAKHIAVFGDLNDRRFSLSTLRRSFQHASNR